LPLPDGAAADSVMFRPEDLRLVDAASAQFAGRVVSSFFLGDHTRLVIDVGSDAMLIARIQERAVFQPGQTVHCAVDAGSVMALRAGAE
jgi:putative spermidine/putrescine transport system ATP-binding protein